MKGIILAGGKGTRLHPSTISISKQLLPVYDKPMIYYPLSVLMLAGIKNILIITTPHDLKSYKNLLGSGTKLGIKLEYMVQDQPKGLAEAFIIGEQFIGGDNVCLILGDNIIYGDGLTDILAKSITEVEKNDNAVTFGYYVNNPSSYGIFEFDSKGSVIEIVEKPKIPKSNFAVIGLYFYPNNVVEISKNVKPSERGELEITCINKDYLNYNKLKATVLGRGYTWMDTGTHDYLLEASQFIMAIEKRTGLKVGCIEEIALNKNFITKQDLIKIHSQMNKNSYSDYIYSLIN
ncbi:glucose-1-phosphate thymidylyltransferase RfbA [Flavobacteriaceae bacterium]|jgi:glucose-1-phosphate thymidylyltransferase|nr:glucose-1-phosphate thymidylyltransferase RfbA [Flavobacteriaceae bacterium]